MINEYDVFIHSNDNVNDYFHVYGLKMFLSFSELVFFFEDAKTSMGQEYHSGMVPFSFLCGFGMKMVQFTDLITTNIC